MEERHKCKLCSRTFANGRALGGHMKAHLATLPLPPKPQPFKTQSSSFSYSSSESEQGQEAEQQEEKVAIYALRENPKKSFRIADPEFSFAAAAAAAAPDTTTTGSVVVIVQDRESETESSKNPTRQRSKRNRNRNSTVLFPIPNLQKKPKLSFVAEPPHAEPEPVVSSVSSDASTEEDVAMCLMMLSRDTWKNKNKNNNNNNAAKQDQQQQEEGEQEQQIKEERVTEIKVKRVNKGKKHECEGCGKTFRSSRALGSHRSICCRGESSGRGGGGDERVFECPFCLKVFGSGQALGGHKRSHLMGIAATSSSTANNESVTLLKSSRESFIDLNLPAPSEEGDDDDDDDELSVVSDA